MTRTARCQCGGLSAECRGEPEHVFLCHCTMCQRRTGTAFNLGAWFPAEDVVLSGPSRTFRRTGDQGHEWVFQFCPECGTSLCWRLDSLLPGQIGIAVGCFADPDFPGPTRAFFARSRHHWVVQPGDVPSHVAMIDSELE